MIGADVAYRPDSARRWRLWGLFVCAAIALAGAAMAVFRAESQRIEAAARQEASGRIAVGASATEQALDRAVRDLQYVARSVALRTAIEGSDRAALRWTD